MDVFSRRLKAGSDGDAMTNSEKHVQDRDTQAYIYHCLRLALQENDGKNPQITGEF